MTKSKRAKQAEQNDAYWRHRRHVDAGTIRERYPNVSTVTATFNFAPYHDGLADARTETHRKEPQHTALFVYDCRMNDCSHGGYDLDVEVGRMLTAGEALLEGDTICRGAVGRHSCHDHLHYGFRAEYIGG